MNPHLQEQQDSFKKALRRQPEIQRHVVQRDALRETTSAPGRTLQPATYSGTRPLNSYIHSIISYLRQAETPVSLEEISAKLNINLAHHPLLLDQVCRSDQVSYDGKTLAFRPSVSITSKEDILRMLKTRHDMSGIELTDLRSLSPKAEDLCQTLANNKDIFILRLKEDGPKIFFANDYKVLETVDSDIKSLWNSVQIPADSFELHSMMEKAAIRTFCRETPRGDSQKSPSTASKKSKAMNKRPYRRFKITNDYLEGIDLSQDLPEAGK